MKRDTLVLAVALLCGVAAFSLIFNFLKQAAQPKLQYVVTRAEMAKGQVITPEDLTLSEPLAGVSASQHFTQMYEVIGMEIVLDLPAKHLISRTELKKPEIKVEVKPSVAPESQDIVLPVPPGMRALTLGNQELENNPISLRGGDYVDILGNVIYGNNQNKEIRTILRGVLVLSVQKSGDLKQINEVSLALQAAQVETLLNASKFGKMRLVVTQKPADNTTWSDMGSIEVIRGIQRERKVT